LQPDDKSRHSAAPAMNSQGYPLRYALYFTPSKADPLNGLASRWLGRDAFTGELFPASPFGGLNADERDALTEEPRRYGFHATLKAPFELAASVTESDLMGVAGDFAARTAPFVVPKLVLGQLGRFFALVPDWVYPELQDFSANVVRAFEPLRASLSSADIARRKPDQLDEAHRANLLRWGYPYVMDQFRFHMTLTGPVAVERQPMLNSVLRETFAAHIGQPLPMTGLAVFVEETRGAPFIVRSWLPLGGAPS
jgi:putative phosphonate metabolism protein